MAFNFRKTRYSAICHLLLGGLCVIFGIADRATMYKKDAFHTEGVIAIWMGAWFFITGILGGFATQRIPNSERPKGHLVGTYLAFSIVATVFAGVMLICYGIGIAIILSYSTCSEQSRGVRQCDTSYPYNNRCTWITISEAGKCRTSVGLAAMIIIFAIAEFGVGIWASVCCCMGYDGCCCDTSTSPPQMQQGQVVYLQTQQGGPNVAYVMTQGPNGMPVAVPAMTGVPANPIPNQAVGGQQYMMRQNPQYVQPTGGQLHMQNPQGPTAVTPSPQMQGYASSTAQQQPVVTLKQDGSNAPSTGNKVAG